MYDHLAVLAEISRERQYGRAMPAAARHVLAKGRRAQQRERDLALKAAEVDRNRARRREVA